MIRHHHILLATSLLSILVMAISAPVPRSVPQNFALYAPPLNTTDADNTYSFLSPTATASYSSQVSISESVTPVPSSPSLPIIDQSNPTDLANTPNGTAAASGHDSDGEKTNEPAVHHPPSDERGGGLVFSGTDARFLNGEPIDEDPKNPGGFGLWVIVGVGIFGALLIFGVCIWFCCRKRKERKEKERKRHENRVRKLKSEAEKSRGTITGGGEMNGMEAEVYERSFGSEKTYGGLGKSGSPRDSLRKSPLDGHRRGTIIVGLSVDPESGSIGSAETAVERGGRKGHESGGTRGSVGGSTKRDSMKEIKSTKSFEDVDLEG
ncbi:hypothetical protein MKZ38_006997 [Zalerion maritima]|uniref:REJ domain-containing protein n=1 Tax=Zalerion maritima TaxID=339359 RepID=A0AAD5RN38_9PEZI|nr:hypothetical protein MKZ38_006997 [Zalerion maritima]